MENPGVGRDGQPISNSIRAPHGSDSNSTGADVIDSMVRGTEQLSIQRQSKAQELNAGGDVKAGPSLNPFAVEFVPSRSFALPQPKPAPQQPPASIYYGASNGDNKYSHRQQRHHKHHHHDGNGGGESNKNNVYLEPNDVALDELKEFIDMISSEPANYDSMLPYITEVLNTCMDEEPEILMMCTVNNIVDQAIVDPNFRYNGVRLCIHLIGNLKGMSPKGTFRDVLLQRCQREHNRRSELAVASDGGLYLRGLTLFLGDLSTQLGSMELLQCLPDLINTLMSNPSTDNIKSACMALKLCGAQLEEVRGKQREMEQIMSALRSFILDPKASNSAKELAKNVIELHSNGWKSIHRAPAAHNPYAVPLAAGDFFADDGNAGYASCYGNSMMEAQDPYMGGYDLGGDEDKADVCDAFEEFLRASGQL